MRRVLPHGASAAAETDDAELAGVAALRLRPHDGGVEICEQLGVWLGVDDRHQLGNLGDLGEILALAEVIVGGDGEGARLGEATRDILNVFVQSKDLHSH